MTKSSGPRGHKILAAGTTALIAEPVLALAHQGGIGVIAGLFLGAAAYVAIENIEDTTGKSLALPARAPRPPREKSNRTASGTPSFAKRLLVGKSVREAAANVPADLEEEVDAEPEDTYIPEEDEDVLQDVLELGADLHPHVDTVLSKQLAILGMSGAGKSNLVADLVEELGQYDAPIIVLDHKGEYGPLCATPYLLRPVHANAQNLTPANARAFAQRIMTERLQVVVDLSSYRDADAALVMAGLVTGVANYQKPLDKAGRITCTFVLEEAHYWLPQDQSQSTIRGIKNRGDENGQTLLAYLQQTFFQLAKIGRYLGMGLIVATQRPADVDNRLISSAEWYFLLKALLPADLARYKGFGAPDGVAQKLNPKQGEAYVVGPDGITGLYHIRRRYSPDESPTPGLANIRNAVATGIDSRVARSPEARAFERGNAYGNGNNGNGGNRREQPVEPFPHYGNGRERSPILGNSGNDSGNADEEDDYSQAEELRVLLAYAELLKESSGKPVTRRALLAKLEWGSRKFTRIVKPVCDKHGIAMQES
jgi:hypothetical protein